MAVKRDKPEEIVTKLRQVEVQQGQGMPVADEVRQAGVRQQGKTSSRDGQPDLNFISNRLKQIKTRSICLTRIKS
jgi:hypothetical protein